MNITDVLAAAAQEGPAPFVVGDSRSKQAQATRPGELVEQAQRLLDKAEELMSQAVIAERQRGTSWEQIGRAHGGMSKSAVYKRYGQVAGPFEEQVADVMERGVVESETRGPLKPIRAAILISAFDMAYALVERTWDEVDAIVHDQDVLRDLRNATLAASGQTATVGDNVLAEVHAAPINVHMAAGKSSNMGYADFLPRARRAPWSVGSDLSEEEVAWLRSKCASVVRSLGLDPESDGAESNDSDTEIERLLGLCVAASRVADAPDDESAEPLADRLRSQYTGEGLRRSRSRLSMPPLRYTDAAEIQALIEAATRRSGDARLEAIERRLAALESQGDDS
ncbi:hypothetical protein AB0J38_14270 [Streptomyces sp. NPDC050095]|uniref:hypothetical protein n=1 Tax=unclassified Streptomyces TaxID=2593676 RepID=UPI00341787E8